MDCYAICTAGSYAIKPLEEHFKKKHKTSRFREALHVRWDLGDLFFFPYGAFVSWGLGKEKVKEVIGKIKDYETNPLEMFEKDAFTYSVDGKSSFKEDHLSLGDNDVFIKLAFSHGLAQSVKLGNFETMIQSIFEKTRFLPEALAEYGSIPLSRKEIRKCMGLLFLERSSINLHVNVLDTPEFFWEYPLYEPLYQMTAVELDLQTRAKGLNRQLDVMHDLFEVLGNELNHQHSSRLELAIILLIVLEVVLLFLHDILKVI